MQVKYPHIRVKLVGNDGNAFAILASVRHKMKRAGLSKEEIETFLKEATTGDYNHLLCTCAKWVDVY